MALATDAPYKQYFDLDGSPLDGGRIYFGVANENPETDPVTVYWDAAATQPAAQPIRTLNGYTVRNGSPAVVYATGDYSITVKDRKGRQVYYAASSEAFSNDQTIDARITQLIADLASTASATKGAGMSGWDRSLAYADDTVGAALNSTPVSVLEFGSGTELGARLQAAIDAGHTSIYIPAPTIAWTWTTPVVLPELWRGRIFSDASKKQSFQITAATGHNYPMIDAQGALFVEIENLPVLASDAGGAAPACFVVFARMPSGASSSNHRVSGCIVEGPFYYCVLYNVGGEELVFENNYWALFSVDDTGSRIGYRTACIVHTLNEESYYSDIVTKAARTNAVSTSAIQHRGDVVKYQAAAGGSGVYIGPNTNDVLLDLAYGYASDGSNFLTLGGYFDGIRLGAERVEVPTKSSRIVYAPNDATAGLVSLFKGAYRRGGASTDSNVYAVDIAGTTASTVSVHIAPQVSWWSSFGGATEDIYLLRSTRKTQLDVSFLLGGPSETLLNTRVNIATLLNSSIVMGKSANLTIASQLYGNRFFFFGEAGASLAHRLSGGLTVGGGATFSAGAAVRFNGTVGSHESMRSTLDSTSNGIHAYFYNPNGVVGSISSSGSATAYATSSDERLKQDIVDAAYDATLVPSFRVRDFKWRISGEREVGFIAQELYGQAPKAVVVGGDDPARNPWGVDLSKLVPALVLEVQALRRRLDEMGA